MPRTLGALGWALGRCVLLPGERDGGGVHKPVEVTVDAAVLSALQELSRI